MADGNSESERQTDGDWEWESENEIERMRKKRQISIEKFKLNFICKLREKQNQVVNGLSKNNKTKKKL